MSKRLALISDHASPLAALGGVDSGGQNVYVAHLAKNLASMGYEIDVFTRCEDGEQPEIVDCSDGYRVIHVPAGPREFVPKEQLLQHMPAFTDFMEQYCRRRHYHLLHANFFMSGLVAANLKKRLGIPFVITFHALGRVRRIHQGQDDAFADERFAIEDRIVAEADHIIAECPQDEEDLLQHYKADPHKITIIPAGFDPLEFGPVNKTLARIVLGLPMTERLILQLGRMVPRKGVETVIRGLACLHENHQIPAHLVVVGGESEWPDPSLTPEIGRLQGIAEELGVNEHVTFVGRRQRDVLKYYYSAADVFVSVPWYEPFGMTPVESMACGTPVIGAAVGGIKYTVKDGETGYLIPPRNPQILGDYLAHCFRKPQVLQRLGQQAIQRVNDNFTWRHIARAIAHLCEKTVGEPASLTRSQKPASSMLGAQNDRQRSLQLIDDTFSGYLQTVQRARQALPDAIYNAAQAIAACYRQDGKVLICGLGGSASQAKQAAAEMIGRFKKNGRLSLPALALNGGNDVTSDVRYADVFARQIHVLGKPGDLLIGVTANGCSRNLAQAFAAARQRHMGCVALTAGPDKTDDFPDAATAECSVDICIPIPSTQTARVEETQLLVLHLISDLVEQLLQNQSAFEAPAPTVEITGTRAQLQKLNGRSPSSNGQSKTARSKALPRKKLNP